MLTGPWCRMPLDGMDVPAAGRRLWIYVQLLKSISATFVVVAGRAFNGAAVESFAVVCSDGVQSGVPPLNGITAPASTVKSTSPVAGVEYVNPEEEKMPTLGLLAGTTSV